jgi:hypothetical protein
VREDVKLFGGCCSDMAEFLSWFGTPTKRGEKNSLLK